MSSLSVDALLDRASSRAQSDNLGSDGEIHLEGLRELAASIDTDQLDDRGRMMVADELTWWLEKCLNFQKDLISYPEIPKTPTQQPMFIVGFGRTGSTFLHNLLATDRSMHAPQLWELLSSSPPPRAEEFTTDARIENTRSYLAQIASAAPGIFEVHPMEAQTPDECHWMMRHGPHLSLRYPAIGYWRWFRSLKAEHLRRLYSYYGMQIKCLQAFNRRGRWLGKSLVHEFYLPVLFDVFPDARVVRLHRDPCECIASLASLTCRFRQLYGPNVNRSELGGLYLDWFAEGAERSRRFAEETRPGAIFDIYFDELTRDPMRVVRDLYAHFKIELSPDTERAFARFIELKSERQRSRGHKYSLEDFGLTANQVLDRLPHHRDWTARQR